MVIGKFQVRGVGFLVLLSSLSLRSLGALDADSSNAVTQNTPCKSLVEKLGEKGNLFRAVAPPLFQLLQSASTSFSSNPYKDTLSAEQTRNLAARAFQFITKASSSAERSDLLQHLQDHFEVLSDPQVLNALQALGISKATVAKNALIHDLGKLISNAPEFWMAAMNFYFPKPELGTLFLPRNILGHEFLSMIFVSNLGGELHLSQHQILEQQRLIAGHNAGYRESVPGFWLPQWPQFASRLQQDHLDVPLAYPSLGQIDSGESYLRILLAAVDRGVSLSMASQKKFARLLPSQKKWSNQDLQAQIASELKHVQTQVRDVLLNLFKERRMPPASDADQQKELQLLQAIEGALERKYVDELKTLQGRLRAGQLQAPAHDFDPQSTIFYKSKAGKFYAISHLGDVYEYTASWKKMAPADPSSSNPVNALFALIEPDMERPIRELQWPAAFFD